MLQYFAAIFDVVGSRHLPGICLQYIYHNLALFTVSFLCD